jgi:hypothetical protein
MNETIHLIACVVSAYLCGFLTSIGLTALYLDKKNKQRGEEDDE